MKNYDNSLNLNLTRKSNVKKAPQQFTIALLDYVKIFYNWLFLFRKKSYSVEPGLYFTGDIYDKEAPLLVTCNFLLTVVLLYRKIKGVNVRLLIIDTSGINVWCSSGKGSFSAEEIVDKLNMYDKNIISSSKKVELILPKLSLSGVKLSILRENGIAPVIGPVYAKNLKCYLDHRPYKDCSTDIVDFNLKERAFTIVPTAIQFFFYGIIIGFFFLILDFIFKTGFYWQIIMIPVAISIVYPILFPWLPGRRFAVKGISLAIFFSIYTVCFGYLDNIPLTLIIFYISYIFGTSIFLALSYTGNSAVSNYSKVKKEIASFLPLNVLFYIITIVFYFINGAYR